MRSFLTIFISIYFFSMVQGIEPIAIISKLRGKVELYSQSDKGGTMAGLNTALYDQDKIIVDKNSFCKLVFLDDGSTINIFPNSEIKIEGAISQRLISKNINLQYGYLQADVKNQILKKFILVTDHSELSCMNCQFWAIAHKSSGDKFYMTGNPATIVNPSVAMEWVLDIDSTISSVKGTDLLKTLSSAGELKFLELLLFDAGEISNEPTEKLRDSSTEPSKKTENVVRIKLKNAANLEREIIFKYSQVE